MSMIQHQFQASLTTRPYFPSKGDDIWQKLVAHRVVKQLGSEQPLASGKSFETVGEWFRGREADTKPSLHI